MKSILLILTLIINLQLFGQNFNGIQLGKSLQQTELELKQKGFTFSNEITPTIRTYNGKIGETPTKVSIVLTPTSKIVWKIQVEVDQSYSWYSSKSSFSKYRDILIEKYGTPKDEYTFFSKPYYEGDGYEMSAIRNDKCVYFNSWENEEGYIVLELRSYKYDVVVTTISYENKKASNIKQEETKTINSKTF